MCAQLSPLCLSAVLTLSLPKCKNGDRSFKIDHYGAYRKQRNKSLQDRSEAIKIHFIKNMNIFFQQCYNNFFWLFSHISPISLDDIKDYTATEFNEISPQALGKHGDAVRLHLQELCMCDFYRRVFNPIFFTVSWSLWRWLQLYYYERVLIICV